MMINRFLMVFLVAVPMATTFRLGHTGFKFAEIADSQEKFDSVFQKFSKTFKKFYFHKGEAEERKRIFQENLEKMEKQFKHKHNFEVNVNKFTDVTWEEFQKQYLMHVDLQKDFKEFEKKHPESCVRFNQLKEMGYFKFPSQHNHGHQEEHFSDQTNKFKNNLDKQGNIFKKSNKRNSFKEKNFEFGASKSRLLQDQIDANRAQRLKRQVDWRKFTSPVQDQMRCASCYAFSAIGTFETMYAIKKELSLQSLRARNRRLFYREQRMHWRKSIPCF